MLEQKLKHQDLHPLLSRADIVSLLKYALPKRAVTQDEILRQMDDTPQKAKIGYRVGPEDPSKAPRSPASRGGNVTK